jgi:hypothetical protein
VVNPTVPKSLAGNGQLKTRRVSAPEFGGLGQEKNSSPFRKSTGFAFDLMGLEGVSIERRYATSQRVCSLLYVALSVIEKIWHPRTVAR